MAQPGTRAFYEQKAAQYARMYGVPANIFLAQINQESGFNPNAHSGAGADGIAQIVPRYHPGVNTRDPIASLRYAAKYDKDLIQRYGSIQRALSAYNSGRPDTYKSPGFAQGQTYNYVRSILAGAKKYGGSLGTLPAPVSRGPRLAKAATPSGARALTQALGQQPGAASSTGYRQALLSNLVAQQNAYLTHQPYFGPSVLQTAAQFHQPQPTQVLTELPAQQAGGASKPVPVVKDHSGPLSPHTPAVIQQAKHYLGLPYRWGGTSPKTGFDCSGFVQYLYGKQGIKIGRTTYDQIKQGQHVGRKALKPGDVIFFSSHGDVHHEALYIGHNQFIHSPKTGDVIKISSLNDPYYASQFAGGRRFI